MSNQKFIVIVRKSSEKKYKEHESESSAFTEALRISGGNPGWCVVVAEVKSILNDWSGCPVVKEDPPTYEPAKKKKKLAAVAIKKTKKKD